MVNKRFVAITWVLLALAVPPAWANSQVTSEPAEALAAILRGYHTYQADFIQIVVNENGNRVQETRGKLKAKRPGVFYWETGAPLSQFIVSDGRKVEVYDPDLEQVTIHALDDRVTTTPALLLSGEVGNLDETYEVSERELDDDAREFRLTPREPDSLFISLRLSFRDGQLQEMRMEDSLSQLSILSFTDVLLNRELDNEVFRLDYPEGVDIIRDDA